MLSALAETTCIPQLSFFYYNPSLILSKLSFVKSSLSTIRTASCWNKHTALIASFLLQRPSFPRLHWKVDSQRSNLQVCQLPVYPAMHFAIFLAVTSIAAFARDATVAVSSFGLDGYTWGNPTYLGRVFERAQM